MNIGEASAVCVLLHFINPQDDDRPDWTEAMTAAETLRDRAAKALQVSGESIIYDHELRDAIETVWQCVESSQWDEEEADEQESEYGNLIRGIEDVDTKGKI